MGNVRVNCTTLGTWRKHPNLHGFIVETFADGLDECQEIGLSEEDLTNDYPGDRNAANCPIPRGPFFGESDDTPERVAEDTQIFQEALAWLKTEEEGVWRSVIYQASW